MRKQCSHKVLTYIEYRAVSDVFQNIDPPPPSPPSECVLPPHQRRGVHTRRAVRGWGNILEDARHWIGLLQCNLSTSAALRVEVHLGDHAESSSDIFYTSIIKSSAWLYRDYKLFNSGHRPTTGECILFSTVYSIILLGQKWKARHNFLPPNTVVSGN
jgi:hypothetical protein